MTNTPEERARGAAVESFRACWRAAISAAYAKQVLKGITFTTMAQRLDCDEHALEEMAWNMSEDISIRDISDLCWAMDCEPVFEMTSGHVRIAVVPIDEEPHHD